MIYIQFLAMFTMLIDHIGAVWFPENPVYRIIGRLALPFYAYAMVIGYFKTRSINRYLKRVGLLAILSQLPFMLAFNTTEINVIGTLFIGLLLLHLLDRWKGKLVGQAVALGTAIILLEIVPIDYGAYAVLLMLMYRYAPSHWMILIHLLLNIASIFTKSWGLQMFSLFSTMLIVLMPQFLNSLDKIRIPRIIWRSFYPAHLSIIAITYSLLNS